MRRVATIASVLVIVLTGAYLAASWYLVRVMVTIDRKPGRLTPVELGFPDAEELSFIASDGVRLIGWFVPSTTDQVIVLVHGIYSNAWDCQTPDVVRAYQDKGFNVFLFDSRGQGKSGGTLGLAWVERQDVRAAVDLMLARGFRAGTVGIHGTSYGAATTILAAAAIPEVGAIVADSAFADVRDVMLGEVARRTVLTDGWARLLSPGLGFMVQRRLGADLDEISPEKAIAAISPRPVLLVHGEDDSIIPVRSVHRLRSAAGPNATVWILPERQHTEGVRLPPDCETPSPLRTKFLLRITEFFQQHLHVGSNTRKALE
jgi:pimeloyl-ACP methyl ester carboxylesterase